MNSGILYLFSVSNGEVSHIEIPKNPEGMKTFRGDLENGTAHNISLENGIENQSSMNVWISRDTGFRFLLDKGRTDVRLYEKPATDSLEDPPREKALKKQEVLVNKNKNIIMVRKAPCVRKVFQCDEMSQWIDVSLMIEKEREDLKMLIHALNVQSCQSFCRVQGFMANQNQDLSLPVCEHEFVDGIMTT